MTELKQLVIRETPLSLDDRKMLQPGTLICLRYKDCAPFYVRLESSTCGIVDASFIAPMDKTVNEGDKIFFLPNNVLRIV